MLNSVSMKELLKKSDDDFFKIKVTENSGSGATVWRNIRRETLEAFIKIQDETYPN
jgi:hypothetical protein